ncbi:MAG: DUF2165 family protein [Pseudomonadota bacterium]
MYFELTLLIAQAATAFFLAAWLTTGVYENLFYSSINSTFTAEVLEMKRMEKDYPEAFAEVSYRQIKNPVLQRFLFRIIVLWELFAVIALWVGTIALVLAIFGLSDPENARALGLFGALVFTATWAGFLIVGNWFCYWFCHEGAQNTHFQMTLWGMATMILLTAG